MRYKLLIIMIMIVIAALLPVSADAASKGKGPVLHLRFDESGGPTAYDDGWTDTDSDGIKDSGESWNNNDGTLTPGDSSGSNDTAGEMWSTAGKIGSALECDGTNDYVSVANESFFDSYLDRDDAFTFEAWVNMTDDSTDHFIIAKEENSGNYRGPYILASNTNSDTLVMVLEYNGSTYTSVRGSTDIIDDNWHHVVGVNLGNDGSASDIKLYVDGKLEAMTTMQDNLGVNSVLNNVPLTIGSRASGGVPLKGEIDDVKIYDYARSAAQIMVDYNAGMATYSGTGTDPSEGNAPVLYLPFDENTGTTAYDRSGGGADATFTNLEATDWTSGKYGSCLEFNTGSGGGDEKVTGTVSSANPTNYTTMAWIYLTAYPASGNSNIIRIGGRYLSINSSKKFYVYCYGLTDEGYHASNAEIPLNKWTHLAHVWDGSNIYMYIDGKLDRAVSNGSSPSQSMGFYDIGCEGTTRELFGKIDEVKVYNYARTQAQVAYDYNKGKPVAHYRFDEGGGSIVYNSESSANSGSAPVGWWRMDESAWNGTADEVVDSSGRGLHGVRTGSATTTSSSKVGPYCGTFNGSTDYASTSATTVTNFTKTDAFTVEAWVYNTAVPADWQSNTIVANSKCSEDNYKGWRMAYNQDKKYYAALGYYDGSWHNIAVVGDNTYEAGEWHHVAYVNTGVAGEQKIYVNGVDDGGTLTNNTDSFSYSGAHLIYIGRRGVCNDSYHEGRIDDVRVYNYARTAEQIYNDYKSTHGTMVADTKFVDGKIGKALEFDGTGDYVDCGNDGIFNVNIFTIEGWFKIDAIGDWRWAACKHPTADNDGFRVGFNGSNKWIFRDRETSVDTISNGSVTADTWYHVAWVKEGTGANELKVYVNGALDNSGTSAGSFDNTAPLLIGKWNGATDEWDGLIDDLRFYNYARTAAQISKDHNAGLAAHTGIATGIADPWGGALPIGHWKLDENTGVLARDASGNGNDGTITGATWTQGKHGSCLDFDGSDDEIDAAGNENANFTASAWIKVGTMSAWEGVLEYTNSAAAKRRRGIGFDNAGSPLMVYDEGKFKVSTSGDIDDGAWHHVVATFDGTTPILYVDGSSITLGTEQVAAGGTEALDLRIGDFAVTGYNFSGQIDDARIYDYALTQAQVAWLYNRGKPVAHYRFDEATSGAVSTTAGAIKDDSVHDNDGTASNTTWSYATGKFGGALTFDGNDYVSVSAPGGSSLDITGDITISAWVNLSTKGDWERIVAKRTTSIAYMLGLNDDTDQKWNAYLHNGSSGTSLDSIGAAETGAWVHIAMTLEGTTFTLYKNGEYNNSTTHTGGINSNTDPVQIGRQLTGYNLDGLIDDVRIYNYARTAAQIMQDYNQGMAAKLSD